MDSEKYLPRINNNKEKIDINSSKIMFKDSGLTVGDILQMVVAFTLRFGLSIEGRQSLIEMLKTCAGPEMQNLNLSNHYIDKVMSVPANVLSYYFYCVHCYSLLMKTVSKFRTQIIVCTKCKRRIELSFLKSKFFIVIDLEYQINLLLQRNEILSNLFDNLSKRNLNAATISDVQISELQKKIISQNPNIISFNMNVDGAPIHRSSFWGIQIILNDLDFCLRCDNILLAGMMLVSKEPCSLLLDLYLSTFVDQLEKMNSKNLICKYNDKSFELKFTLYAVCVDTPARAITQKRVRFNGLFGSSYCYEQGKHIGGSMKYPLNEKSCTLRTNQSNKEDIEIFIKTLSALKSSGVKVTSILSSIPNFSMIWSFPFEIMHAIYIVVSKFSYDLWCKFYLKKNKQYGIKTIDSRLELIRPIREVHKNPLPLTKAVGLQAKDWKNWLLYYSLPVCLDLLPEKILENHALLVNSTFTLSQTTITHDEINQCDSDLEDFVKNFGTLFGEENVRNNVHMTKHFAESVRLTAPAWSTSAFPYEGNICYLKRYVNGTRGVGQQMAKKSLQTLAFKTDQANRSCSTAVKEYCDLVLSKKVKTETNNAVTFYDKISDNIIDNDEVIKYERFLFEGHTYTFVNYKKCLNFNDSTVQLKSGSFYTIIEIASVNGNCLLLLRELKVIKLKIGNVEVQNTWVVVQDRDQSYHTPQDILHTVIFIEVDNKSYVCTLPNFIDVD